MVAVALKGSLSCGGMWYDGGGMLDGKLAKGCKVARQNVTRSDGAWAPVIVMVGLAIAAPMAPWLFGK